MSTQKALARILRITLILLVLSAGALALAAVPPSGLPPRELPPGAYLPPKELPPTITVTGPAAGKAPRYCEGETAVVTWDSFGNVGESVTLRLSSGGGTRTVPGLPVRGSYSWETIGQGKGGYAQYTVTVEAANGKAKGTGGILDIYGPNDKHCGTGKYGVK